MERRHINKKKHYEADTEWNNLVDSSNEKFEEGEVLDIQDRAITFNNEKYVTTKEEDYKKESKDFKERFGNTAQYLKFVNAHLAEKNNHLNKILGDSDRFEEDLAILNPEKITKEQLDKKNYTKLRVEDVRKVLEYVQEERDAVKDKIDHFSTQIDLAKKELENKNKEIDEIKSEITITESSEIPNQNSYDETDNTTKSIQNELKNIASKKDSEKIFGAINSLIVLLNSKNETTLNEIKSVKTELNKIKKNYEKVMSDLEIKKNKNN
jgi:chromosome segregation ATPase